MELRNLLGEDETIMEYGITTAYTSYNAIMRQDFDDVSAALEDTLHRILDNGGTSDDVQRIMGAFIPTEEEMTGMYQPPTPKS